VGSWPPKSDPEATTPSTVRRRSAGERRRGFTRRPAFRAAGRGCFRCGFGGGIPSAATALGGKPRFRSRCSGCEGRERVDRARGGPAHRSLHHGCDGGHRLIGFRGGALISTDVRRGRLCRPRWNCSSCRSGTGGRWPRLSPLAVVAVLSSTTGCYRCCFIAIGPVHRAAAAGAVDGFVVDGRLSSRASDPPPGPDDAAHQVFATGLGNRATGWGLRPSQRDAPVLLHSARPPVRVSWRRLTGFTDKPAGRSTGSAGT